MSSTANANDPGGEAPEPELVVAIAAALLLQHIEGASFGGRIGYVPVNREPRPERLFVNEIEPE